MGGRQGDVYHRNPQHLRPRHGRGVVQLGQPGLVLGRDQDRHRDADGGRLSRSGRRRRVGPEVGSRPCDHGERLAGRGGRRRADRRRCVGAVAPTLTYTLLAEATADDRFVVTVVNIGASGTVDVDDDAASLSSPCSPASSSRSDAMRPFGTDSNSFGPRMRRATSPA